eukprot:gb/GEZN01001319.1/.p2 GENE.gb/GEZN01001319.1/~~gb/GEZN01001319.1/.p2  ORF type:complete len:501 (-),score=43.37 gb/GEZN01001319.1/:1638-3119(-)
MADVKTRTPSRDSNARKQDSRHARAESDMHPISTLKGSLPSKGFMLGGVFVIALIALAVILMTINWKTNILNYDTSHVETSNNEKAEKDKDKTLGGGKDKDKTMGGKGNQAKDAKMVAKAGKVDSKMGKNEQPGCPLRAPTNGQLGNCTSVLKNNDMCVPTCNNGFYVSGQFICLNQVLVMEATCAPNNTGCPLTAPTNGVLAPCTSPLPSGQTCVPTCNTGFQVNGTFSCLNGALSAQATCVVLPGSVWKALSGPVKAMAAGSWQGFVPYFIAARVTTLAIQDPNKGCGGTPYLWLGGSGGLYRNDNPLSTNTPVWKEQSRSFRSSVIGYAHWDEIRCKLYVGTGDRHSVAGLGLYTSNNAGATFTELGAFSPTDGKKIADYVATNGILTHPTQNNLLYVATSSANLGKTQTSGGDQAHPAAPPTGVWKSVDGGATFTILRNQEALQLEIDPVNPIILYAAFFDGVYRSLDGGANWGILYPSIPSEILTHFQ